MAAANALSGSRSRPSKWPSLTIASLTPVWPNSDLAPYFSFRRPMYGVRAAVPREGRGDRRPGGRGGEVVHRAGSARNRPSGAPQRAGSVVFGPICALVAAAGLAGLLAGVVRVRVVDNNFATSNRRGGSDPNRGNATYPTTGTNTPPFPRKPLQILEKKLGQTFSLVPPPKNEGSSPRVVGNTGKKVRPNRDSEKALRLDRFGGGGS